MINNPIDREKAVKLLINDCIKTGKFYLDDRSMLPNGNWFVEVYYHYHFKRYFTFRDELTYQVFVTKLSNGYNNYYEFSRDCDYNMDERLESFYAAALK